MATIVDVARLAGVTPTTVSRVINNRGYISEKTKKRVHEVMDELGYQPNEIARSLTKQKSNTIGVIVPHISHPYFAKLISNLENEAAKKDYKIILCNSKEKAEKEKQYLDMCKSNRVAGIIICSGNVESNKINTGGIPVVLLEKNFEEGKLGIQCDNYQGGKLATEHLIECGCKKILHLSGVIDEEMPAYAGELVKYSGLTAATISHHMSQLAEASLIRLEKIDTKVYYSVNKEMLQKCFGFYQKKLLHP